MTYKRMTKEERDAAIARRRAGERRTAAKVFEDPLGEDITRQLMAKEMNEYPQYADYPEHLVDILRCFVNEFKFPKRLIPYRKNKSAYSFWITQLEELYEICGEHYEKAIKMCKIQVSQSRSGYSVNRPKSLIPLLPDVMRRIQEDIDLTEQSKPKKEEIKVASKNSEGMKMLKELENKLREQLYDD